MAKLARKNAVVELNRVVSRFDGDIKAQYPMAATLKELENGMAVVVDDIKKTINKPATKDDYVYLHYSEEKVYVGGALNSFKLVQDSACPRCYKLVYGDTFTTDAVEMGAKDLATLKTTDFTVTKLYAVPDPSGLWKLVDTYTNEKVVLQVQKLYTAPNGVDPAFKFVVIKAQA